MYDTHLKNKNRSAETTPVLSSPPRFQLLDHVIIPIEGYYSFADDGLI
jgi:hypothetical protein